MSKVTIAVLATLGVCLLAGFSAALTSCTKVQAGHVGVSIKKCGGGGVDQSPIPTGYYWRSLFCEEVDQYPTNLRTTVFADNDSDKVNDGLTVNSKEGLPITVDVSMSMMLEPAKVPAIYERYRADIDTITATFIRQTIREGLQGQFAQFTAEEIYAEKKEIVRNATQDFLIKQLKSQGFMISQFTLNDVRVPKQVVDAINAKVAMTQDAQRAEAEVRKTQALAKQATAKAEGEASAMRLKADAEAYYNQTVAKSITSEFLLYKAQERWDGKLPQFTGGGAVPFIQIPGK